MAAKDPWRGIYARLRWPLRLTWAGLVAERVTRGFWPVWSILFAVIGAMGFNLHNRMPVEVVWPAVVLMVLALVVALWRGVRRFRLPSHSDALARLDATLPGRPLSALGDRLALGGGDAGTGTVWREHQRRMAESAAAARAPAPDLKVAGRDPMALRYAALTLFVMAIAFGSLWRAGEISGLMPQPGGASAAAGPTWEGWVEPPAYTGRPNLYLNTIAGDTLDLPEGSRVTLRFYGDPDALTLTETVSGGVHVPGSDSRAVTFEAMQAGEIAIGGEGGRGWQVSILPDEAPAVEFAGRILREADGTMAQPFTARDDYAVVGGQAEFTLNLDAVDRRFGLAIAPETTDPLVFDLPLPITGSRADFAESLVEDASKHPWSNLPVRMTLTVTDARGQTGSSETRELLLPGRRFFDPVAAALIEMRRDLLWSRMNAARTVQILRAVTHRPEGLIRNERAYLMLRVAIRRLEAAAGQGLSAAQRDEAAEALWEIATLIEDGGLSDALERMRQAQERLSEAIRNGASPEEIQQLMDELKQATDNYIRQLAERAEQQPDEQTSQNGEGQRITGDQIQQMMDEIQRLMEEGRMAEAQELLDQLSRMLENLRVTQGEGGDQMNGPGGQAMRDLQQTLRDQQDLSDEAFRELQDQFGQGQGQGQGNEGMRPGQSRDLPPGEGQAQDGTGDNPGEGAPGPGEGLADRQQALRDDLRRNEGALPGTGSDLEDAARQSLGQAGEAMEEAERALRDGDFAGALDRQADAIEKLREGLRNLGDALAEGQRDQPGNQGEAFGQTNRETPRDPLGRTAGQSGRVGTDENLLQGEDVYRRARDLLDEIRRRAGEVARPQHELDYLKRLLPHF